MHTPTSLALTHVPAAHLQLAPLVTQMWSDLGHTAIVLALCVATLAALVLALVWMSGPYPPSYPPMSTPADGAAAAAVEAG